MNKNKYLQSTDLRRRSIVTGAATWSALAWSGAVHAQTKPPVVIGWIAANSREQELRRFNAFKEGMVSYGWKEGANYVLEERWADGKLDRLPALARELAKIKPQIVVVAQSQPAVHAAKAIPGTPIIMANGNPLTVGLAASLARPGGMVTGLTNITAELSAKLVELLRDALPGVSRFGCLVEPASPSALDSLEWIRRAAAKFGMEPRDARAGKLEEIETALQQLAKHAVKAVIILPSTLLANERNRILKIALAQRWPVFAGIAEFADAGALTTYGADRVELHRRAAYFVDRILKGAKPADLPIEQPTKFELVVNLKTAKALGITIPQSVMVRASRVIE